MKIWADFLAKITQNLEPLLLPAGFTKVYDTVEQNDEESLRLIYYREPDNPKAGHITLHVMRRPFIFPSEDDLETGEHYYWLRIWLDSFPKKVSLATLRDDSEDSVAQQRARLDVSLDAKDWVITDKASLATTFQEVEDLLRGPAVIWLKEPISKNLPRQ